MKSKQEMVKQIRYDSVTGQWVENKDWSEIQSLMASTSTISMIRWLVENEDQTESNSLMASDSTIVSTMTI